MRAGVIPLDQVSEGGIPAIERAAKSISAHGDLEFGPWWRADTDFDFADVRYLNGILAWPWLHYWTHRLDDERIVIVPRSDFLRYHTLDLRPFSALKHGTEYVHPLDHAVVMRTGVQRVAYFNPMPFSEVQRDYLRDYLAARRAALLLAVVADRFAHAPTTAELELDSLDDHQTSESAWITTTVHEQSPHARELAMGRSSLYWNLVVTGYQEPKTRRSPWSFHGDFQPEEGAPAPTFIVSGEGARLPADRLGLGYLYFSPRVLDRYLRTPGYSASFHMRTWGGVSTPYGSVDAGINSRGLLNAFMPDIARLPIAEQQHWAMHSALPDGEICEAMVETRMQQRPPHLPGVIDLISQAMASLRDVFRETFQVELFSIDLETSPEQGGRLSIGPLRGEMQEVAELAVPMYAWIIQPMEVSALRAALKRHSVPFDDASRQIVLLRLVLEGVAKLPNEKARELTGPLTAINELRAKAAHVAAADFEAILPMLRLRRAPSSPRELWDALIDATAESLQKIAQAVRTGDTGLEPSDL